MATNTVVVDGNISTATSTTGSTFPEPEMYDVFLNFRGEDLRGKFVDHLYSRLHSLGVNAFMDEKHLARGEMIETSILMAIQRSRVYLTIFSSGYAESEWCLDELVKIVECVENKGHVVMPVFFLVSWVDVVNQSGVYKEAFARHENLFLKERVDDWRKALVTVAGISGWSLCDNGSEATLVSKISKTIKQVLEESVAPNTNINMGSTTAENNDKGNPLKRKLDVSQTIKELNLFSCQMLEDMAVIRICGLGGLDSTNSAKFIYDYALSKKKSTPTLDPTKPAPEFKWSRKIWDIDGDINTVRTNVGNKKKVLAIVDDMDKLEAFLLVGVMMDWFGSSSRIVLSTVDVPNRVLKVVHIRMKASGGREDNDNGNINNINNNDDGEDDDDKSTDNKYLDVACFMKKRIEDGELMKRVLKSLANGGLPTDIVVKVHSVEYENVGIKKNGELDLGHGLRSARRGRAGRLRSWVEDQPRI
ncbi:Disease resistance protein RPV1, partial [Linum perenne]